MDGDTTTVYTDWRLPTISEISVFEGTITSANYIWTTTPYEATSGNWIIAKLSTGQSANYPYQAGDNRVRCVR